MQFDLNIVVRSLDNKYMYDMCEKVQGLILGNTTQEASFNTHQTDYNIK